MCFNQFFDDHLFTGYGENITSELYKDFLFGNHYDERMKDINFHNVTIDLTEYVLKYEVRFRNGTYMETVHNIAWKPLNVNGKFGIMTQTFISALI